jgi:hypothetical protein
MLPSARPPSPKLAALIKGLPFPHGGPDFFEPDPIKERAGRVVPNPAQATAHEGITSGGRRSLKKFASAFSLRHFKKTKTLKFPQKPRRQKIVDKFPKISATTPTRVYLRTVTFDCSLGTGGPSGPYFAARCAARRASVEGRLIDREIFEQRQNADDNDDDPDDLLRSPIDREHIDQIKD